MPLKSAIKPILNAVFEDYRINWVLASCPAPPQISEQGGQAITQKITAQHITALRQSTTPKVMGSVNYSAAGLDGFVLCDNGLIVCAAHFAAPKHYDRGETWPLGEGEMALMDIATEADHFGKGYAVRLIVQTSLIFSKLGKSRLIAFIWWNNTPSLRAFQKAGWRRIGFVVEIRIAGKWRSLRIPLR
jgi:hypothetical protein